MTKELEKVLEEKMHKMTLEWFMKEKCIYEMRDFDRVLQRIPPSEAVQMTNHDEFLYRDKYFYFEYGAEDRIVSLTHKELETRIKEELTDDDVEKIEKYLINKLKGV